MAKAIQGLLKSTELRWQENAPKLFIAFLWTDGGKS
jgi:hypothetical protein